MSDNQALTNLSWTHDLSWFESKFNLIKKETALLNKVENQLNEYFNFKRITFDIPLKPAGTEFQKKAWAELLKIPYGKFISYGEQAKRIGNAKASRAVGAANGKNPIGIIIPCHRVLGANGSLTGFAGGLSMKKKLLDLESSHSRK